MTREQIEQKLDELREMPKIIQQLLEIVADADRCMDSESQRQVIYDLIGVVAEIGERVNALEWRSARHTVWLESSPNYREVKKDQPKSNR